MKQKLFVIGSLIHDPGNWILDEPMVGLDPQAAFDLKELMRARASAGKCVFFSTHVLEVAQRICDRIAVIARGRLLFTGTIDELRTLRQKTDARAGDEDLEGLFLDLVDDSDSAGKGEIGRAHPSPPSSPSRPGRPSASSPSQIIIVIRIG